MSGKLTSLEGGAQPPQQKLVLYDSITILTRWNEGHSAVTVNRCVYEFAPLPGGGAVIYVRETTGERKEHLFNYASVVEMVLVPAQIQQGA